MKGLRSIRQKLGLTHADLEKLTDIDANSFSRYEREVVTPSIEVAKKVAEALNVSLDELLNGPTKQEFEVKIIMGVKNLPNATGIEIKDDSLVYGVDDEKSRICLGSGMINVGTLEQRKDALMKIITKFQKACWMLDHKDETEAKMPDFSAVFDALQLG